MKINIIFVLLITLSVFQTELLNASCASVPYPHGQSNKPLAMGLLNKMRSTSKRICKFCNKEFNSANSEIKRGGGIFCSKICSAKGMNGENAPHWLGEKVGYMGYHLWVKNTYGKANKCEMCGIKNSKYNWASINHNYTRDINDWKQLCVKCHAKFDGKTREVYQLDDNGIIINKFNSAGDAAKELNIPDRSRISVAATKRMKAVGFYWQMAYNYGKPYKNIVIPNGQKPVFKIENNIIIDEYKSVAEAARQHSTPSSNIFYALRTGNKAKGFHWNYKEQING